MSDDSPFRDHHADVVASPEGSHPEVLSTDGLPTARPSRLRVSLGIAVLALVIGLWFVLAPPLLSEWLRPLLRRSPLLPAVAFTDAGLLLALLAAVAVDGAGLRLHLPHPDEKGWLDWVAVPAIIFWHLTVSILAGLIFYLLYQGKMPKADVASLMQTLGHMSIGELLLTAALVAGLAAIFEELVFRGYLVSRLSLLGLHPLVAGVISAVAFGLIHLSGYGLANSLPKVLGMGLVAGLYVGWRGRLWPGMIAHFLVDFGGLAMVGVALKLGAPIGG